jgi:CRISPR-associated protein Csd1
VILGALKGYSDRLAADPASGIAPYGYSEEKVSFALVLRPDGTLAGDPLDLRVNAGKRLAPRPMLVPRAVKRTVKVLPNFLWDKSSYVLGLTAEPGERTARERAAFLELHEEVLAGTNDEGLVALLALLRGWRPERAEAFGNKDEVVDANLVFRLEGELGFIHERQAAQNVWARLAASREGGAGLCLVTGETAPVARLHPSIKGVRGGQSSGASLVSFNLDAFTSYGKEQGANSPVSEAAAAAYGTALNHLLRPDSPNRVQLADASTVFWAESAKAQGEEAMLALLIGGDDEQQRPLRVDKDEGDKLMSVLADLAKGRPLEELSTGLDERTRFHILGLAPNAARIALRFYVNADFGTLAARFQQHWRDLAIEPLPWRTAPSVRRLLREIAIRGDAETIPPQLAGETMRAILTGGRYPRSLFAAVLMRLRAEHEVTGLRAAILKACLARDARLSGREVSLDDDGETSAGRLGRLFAILEGLQRLALGGNVNATIRDRYYASASATPAAVFPMLVRNATHHVANLRKDGKGGLAYRLEERMAGLLEGIGSEFPRSLGMEDQGRFAIGYYRERFAKRAAAAEAVTGETDGES